MAQEACFLVGCVTERMRPRALVWQRGVASAPPTQAGFQDNPKTGMRPGAASCTIYLARLFRNGLNCRSAVHLSEKSDDRVRQMQIPTDSLDDRLMIDKAADDDRMRR